MNKKKIRSVTSEDIDSEDGTLVMKRFPCPAGCSVKSFVMRELHSHEGAIAAENAEVLNPKIDPTDVRLAFVAELRERIRLSIVAVNDKPVVQPFLKMNTWTVKTFALAERAYNKMNFVSDKELEAFDRGTEIVTRIAVPEENESADEMDPESENEDGSESDG